MVRWLRAIIGLLVTAGFLWLFVHGLELAALRQALAEVSLAFVALALVFLAAGYAVRVIRWWWMLRTLEPGVHLKACIGPFLASIAVNNVMPLRAGDAFRALGFRQQLRSPAGRLVGTIILERILDLIVLLGFFFVGILTLPPGAFPENFVLGMTLLAGLGLGTVLALVLLIPRLGWMFDATVSHSFFARRNLSERILRHAGHLVAALSLTRSPGRLLGLLALSLLAWTLEGAVFAMAAAGVNAGARMLGPWFALAISNLATLIPSAPGYVGTFDYFAAQGLSAYGAPPELAIAFALTVHAVIWAPVTAAGLIYVILYGWDSPAAVDFKCGEKSLGEAKL